MRRVRAALARIAGVFTGHRADDDLRDDMQSHLDMEIAENVRRGMTPDAARRQAHLVSGGLTQAAETVHDQRGLPWIEGVAADFRYGLRALRHSPALKQGSSPGAGVRWHGAARSQQRSGRLDRNGAAGHLCVRCL